MEIAILLNIQYSIKQLDTMITGKSGMWQTEKDVVIHKV